jgi:hypothetical protein
MQIESIRSKVDAKCRSSQSMQILSENKSARPGEGQAPSEIADG